MQDLQGAFLDVQDERNHRETQVDEACAPNQPGSSSQGAEQRPLLSLASPALVTLSCSWTQDCPEKQQHYVVQSSRNCVWPCDQCDLWGISRCTSTGIPWDAGCANTVTTWAGRAISGCIEACSPQIRTFVSAEPGASSGALDGRPSQENSISFFNLFKTIYLK